MVKVKFGCWGAPADGRMRVQESYVIIVEREINGGTECFIFWRMVDTPRGIDRKAVASVYLDGWVAPPNMAAHYKKALLDVIGQAKQQGYTHEQTCELLRVTFSMLTGIT